MQVITRYKAFDGTLFMECDTCREYEADHRYELGVSTIHFYDCVGQDITILCFDDYNRFNEIERIVLDNQVAVEICTSMLRLGGTSTFGLLLPGDYTYDYEECEWKEKDAEDE